MRRTVGFATVGAALGAALAVRGLAADAVGLLDSRLPIASVARALAGLVGEAAALQALVVAGAALSAAALATVRAPAAGLLVFAPVLLTGAAHARPATWAFGLALVALRAWATAPWRAAGAVVALALVSPPAAVAAAVAGVVLGAPGAGGGALVLAVLVASAGEPAVVDVSGLAAVRAVRDGWAAAPTAGLVSLAALAFVGGPWRLRAAGLLAAALTLGPLVVADVGEVRSAAVPLPALPFALLGAESGWSGAGVVALAALALAMEAAPRARAWALAVLVAAEGLTVAAPAPSPLPERVPVAVRSLAERPGSVLYLPVGLHSAGEPPRATLWRHQARLHGRPLYAGGRSVADVDPVLGEPGVLAIEALLHPESGWLTPPTDAGTVLRALGITELVLDRAALPVAELARLDPVLARLYGPPQRDLAGNLDLWRISPYGTAELQPLPHLRRPGDRGTQGWRSLAELLEGGRPVVPPPTPTLRDSSP